MVSHLLARRGGPGGGAARGALSRLGLAGLVAATLAACSFDSSGLGDKAECTDNDECAEGELCISGQCVNDIGCIRNEDCPTGRICVNATCVVGQPDVELDIRDTSVDVPDFGQEDPDVVEDPVADLEDVPPDVTVDLPSDPVEDPIADVEDVTDAEDAIDVPSDLVDAEDVDADAVADAEDADLDVADADDADLPPDVPDDVPDEDAPVVIVVETFGDLPETAPDGTLAYVTDLDEDFTYSAGLARWIFSWFYDSGPAIDIAMSGDVLPSAEPVGWTQRSGGAGTIQVVEGSVRFDTSSAIQDRAWAFYDHGHTGASLWLSGELWVQNSAGTGLFRHTADLRNQERAVAINLATGADGIRIAAGGDVSLGTVLRTEDGGTPRRLDVFLFAGDRAELYVDSRLVQTVPYTELLESTLARYQVGDSVTSGGGIVRVRDLLAGTFTP